jgi:hypothetical protein
MDMDNDEATRGARGLALPTPEPGERSFTAEQQDQMGAIYDQVIVATQAERAAERAADAARFEQQSSVLTRQIAEANARSAELQRRLEETTQSLNQMRVQAEDTNRQRARYSDPARQPAIAPLADLDLGRRRQILPKLDKFNGDRKTFIAWRLAAEIKLEIDLANDNETWRKGAIFHALGDGPAASFALQYHDIPTAGDFLERLGALYFSSSHVLEAEEKLRSLRQGRRGYIDFEEEFRRLGLEANFSKWEESTKVDLFKRAIQPALRSAIEAPVVSFAAAKDRNRPILEDWMRIARDTSASQGTSFTPSFSATPSKATQPWGVALPPPAGPGIDSGDPMDLDRVRRGQDWHQIQNRDQRGRFEKGRPRGRFAGTFRGRSGQSGQFGGRRAKWVSADEFRARREKGLCQRCGASSHSIEQCQFLGAIPPWQQEISRRAAGDEIRPVLADEREREPAAGQGKGEPSVEIATEGPTGGF